MIKYLIPVIVQGRWLWFTRTKWRYHRFGRWHHMSAIITIWDEQGESPLAQFQIRLPFGKQTKGVRPDIYESVINQIRVVGADYVKEIPQA